MTASRSYEACSWSSVKPRRHRDAVRALDDRDVHSETLEHRVKLPIERGHREAITQIQSLLSASIRGDAHEMLDKVETDLEPLRLIDGDATSCQTTDV